MTKISHLDSLWKRHWGELEHGLLRYTETIATYIYININNPEEAKITIRTGYSFQFNPLSDTGTTTLCQGEEMFQFI